MLNIMPFSLYFIAISSIYFISDIGIGKINFKTIIFSTHDLNIAIQEADKIWLMLEDEIIDGAPEDLILNETFNKIFEKSNLSFDKLKGDFRMKRKHSEKIGLIGEGVYFNWTKKALERLNFSVEKGNESILNISIEINDNLHVWKLNENGNKHEFSSIYKLSLYLKKFIKF